VGLDIKKKCLGFLFVGCGLWLQNTFAQQAPAQSPGLLQKGSITFAQNCIACHGELGDGRGPAAVAIVDHKPRDFTTGIYKYGAKPEQIFATITNGVNGTAMPPWIVLSEEERWGLVYYVLSLSRK